MNNLVNHPKFGKGQVICQDDNNVTVDFNGEIKTLVIKFSRLTNEDGSEFGVKFKSPEKRRKTSFEKNLKAAKRIYSEAENRSHANFMRDMKIAELNDEFLPCQIERLMR